MIHNKGIVNSKFKREVRSGTYRIGEKINISKELMDRAINTYHNVAALIDREVKEMGGRKTA
ncbi:hypothetical protein MUP77_06435 [Candidatus Bathyarchaeota archaeon]|nr:hypothetical protein [Candidatus Bathyarchaeota archaeon]